MLAKIAFQSLYQGWAAMAGDISKIRQLQLQAILRPSPTRQHTYRFIAKGRPKTIIADIPKNRRDYEFRRIP
jgi:hypothetical protein